ncbi:glycosyltransferase [Halanaeroarchaeum sulfurireducens]|nr:glycosyltransferase [Halanaeroarchaeum sulfurireducens]
MTERRLEESAGNTVILGSQRWRTGPNGRYLIHFEKAFKENDQVDLIPLSKSAYKLTRFFDILRGSQNATSLPENYQKKINNFGRLIGLSDKPYQLPSIIRHKARNIESITLFAGQIYEIRLLDLINWRDKTIILYIADAWEPKFKRLNTLIEQYDIDHIFASYEKATKYLKGRGHKAYWLPQAINPEIWRDYKLSKKYGLIQFGRKNPTLHKFGKEHFDNEDYIHEFIHGDINLAKHINESEFTLLAPRKLQSPEQTGDISPVTLRYYQAMACKSMPAGFKPREFDKVFSDDIFFLEYENDEQFRSDIEYFKQHKEEYWNRINRNYELMMSNHTWQKRVNTMSNIVNNEI